MKKEKEVVTENPMELSSEQLQNLCKKAIALINQARNTAVREINLVQLLTYYTLGEWIVEVQQGGTERAKYGKKVLETLSNVLNKEFGKGYSVSTLTNIRKFYPVPYKSCYQ